MAEILQDQLEEATHSVSPADNVYSFWLFAAPVQRVVCPLTGGLDKSSSSKKQGYLINMDTLSAWILVGLTFFMQAVLLSAIWYAVVVANMSWQRSIMKNPNIDEDGGINVVALYGEEQGCSTPGSLCHEVDGVYTCAPPSVQLAGRWPELDLDGDGIWTWDEVITARADLKCKYIVDPVEVYKVFVRFLLKREGLIWIHPELRNSTKIHKAYFDYAMGDINMCGYRNPDMCSNVFKRGFFDAPLKHGTAPRVGTTVESAMNYCYELLMPGGACERLLPSTYKVWKSAGIKQCGSSKLTSFMYSSPTGENTTMLEVDYATRLNYAKVQTPTFQTYKMIILCLYTMAMIVELKDIWKGLNWCMKFPSADDFGDDSVTCESSEDGGDKTITVHGITQTHRYTTLVVMLLRVVGVTVLGLVGTVFLLKQTTYVGLLLDGIAMLFVRDISQLLYQQVLRQSLQEQMQTVQPMVFPAIGPSFLTRRPALRSMLWLILTIGIAFTVVTMYRIFVAVPLYDALTCTCIGEGERCDESIRFSYEYWWNYWKETVPASLKTIKNLENGVSLLQAPASHSRSSSSVGGSVVRHATSLVARIRHHYHHS